MRLFAGTIPRNLATFIHYAASGDVMGYAANNQASLYVVSLTKITYCLSVYVCVFFGVRLRILLFILLYLETGNIFIKKR